MILAYALPPLWAMLAAVYLLVAVPLVFIISLVIFYLFGPLGSLTSVRAPAAVFPFALLNLGLTLYFFSDLLEPGGNPAHIDWVVLASVICAPVFLVFCIVRGTKARRRAAPGTNS